jgi:two-component system, NarL family, nitrate/nitrite response regulator NarL
MKGLPPISISLPLRVAFQGDAILLDSLARDTDRLILSPVETSLEISARVSQAEVIVVDVTQNSAKAFNDIRDLALDRPILALVNPGQESDAITAGADGAIRRDSKPKAIAAAIEALHQGLAVFDSRFVTHGAFGKAVMAPQPTASTGMLATLTKGANEVLTPREAEVMTLLAEGLSNKEIAVKLEISEHTAKFHVNSILQKMGAQKRVEAVVRAAKLGLIEI